MKKNIAVINGDGIGPEVTRQSLAVLDAVAEKFGHDPKSEKCGRKLDRNEQIVHAANLSFRGCLRLL